MRWISCTYPIYSLSIPCILYLTLPGHSLHSFTIIISHRVVSCRTISQYGNASCMDWDVPTGAGPVSPFYLYLSIQYISDIIISLLPWLISFDLIFLSYLILTSLSINLFRLFLSYLLIKPSQLTTGWEVPHPPPNCPTGEQKWRYQR